MAEISQEREQQPSSPEGNPANRNSGKKVHVNVVNVLGLLLIVASTLGLIRMSFAFSEVFSLDLSTILQQRMQYVYDLVTALLLFLGAFGLFLRKPWGRSLVLCLMSLSLAVGLHTFGKYQWALFAMKKGGEEDLAFVGMASLPILAGCAVSAFFIAKLLTRKVTADFYPDLDQRGAFVMRAWRRGLDLVGTPSAMSSPGTAQYGSSGGLVKRLVMVIVALIIGGTVFYSWSAHRSRKIPGPAATPLSGVVMAAGGYGHSLALTSDRTVWAWGRNNAGQLGDGTLEDRDAAKHITGPRDIVAVAAGFDHSMALSADGTVWTWGNNDYGQLGDDAPVQRSAPRNIPRLIQVQAIAAGRGHSFALKQDGTVWAWGNNSDGQLGDGTVNRRSEARKVGGLSGVTAIASGRDHSVALRNDGTVWTWGANDEGQLGDGRTASRLFAAEVPGFQGVIAIACGYDFTLALKADGTVWAWGSNTEGELGDGTTDRRRMPVQSAVTDVVAMAAGREHAVILTKKGELKAWGSNLHGQLATGRGGHSLSPVRISNLDEEVKAIASGGYHMLVSTATDRLRTWGHNGYGQLGDRSREYRYEPVIALTQPQTAVSGQQASPGSEIIMIAAGRAHSVALKADGLVWTWGDNFLGQLGVGTRRTISPYPQLVPGLSRVKAVAAGAAHTLALRDDGTVWSWGDNTSRQLGDGTPVQNRAVPVQVAGLTDITAIQAGNCISLALKSDGTVWIWGSPPNSPSPSTASLVPVRISNLANITAISVGGSHELALAGDGTVWAWGDNRFGQVGDGSTDTSTMPVRVAGLNDVAAVAAGGGLSVAIRKDGTVWAWGQVRALTTKDLAAACDKVPTQVIGVQDAVAAVAGKEHVIVLKRDGSLWGWGKNAQSQLHRSALPFTNTPIKLEEIASATKLAAGWYFNLAVLKDGKLMAWGFNDYGQIGDGSQGMSERGSDRFDKGAIEKRTPVAVIWNAAVLAETSEPTSTRPDIKVISAGGSHSALLMADGTVWTWGDDAKKQLGVRSNRTIAGKQVWAQSSKHLPLPIASLTNIRAIDAGPFHSLALKNDGTVVEWGRSYADVAWEQWLDDMSPYEKDQIVHSNSAARGKPLPSMNNDVAELTDVASVVAGHGFSLALKNDGTVWTWGLNTFGQLGDGTTEPREFLRRWSTSPRWVPRLVPRQVPGLIDVQALAAGQSYVLALKVDGSVWAWGAVGKERVAIAMKPVLQQKPSLQLLLAKSPVRIDGLSEVTAIAGGSRAYALKSDGTVWICWDWDRDDTTHFSPAPVKGLTGVRAISARGAHLLALMNDGTVRTVRRATWGEKDGQNRPGLSVEQVEEISDAIEIAAGGGHSLVMKHDGTVWSWGDNNAGQLGDATEIGSEMPVKLRIQ